MTIRRVNSEDIETLQKIGQQTFFETFSLENSQEDMAEYLEKNFAIEKLTKELNDADSEFYFAEFEGTVVGYLKVNAGISQTEMKTENSLEIERIYVIKEFLGKKVGQVLYEKAIAIAITKKVDFVWLGVWEENMRAIRFYEKNGFIAFDKHIFKLGDDEQTDIMMKLNLTGF